MNMQSNTALYDLQFSESRTWLVAALMSVGNILLPQLCHLVPQGGLILLPIYFFTLIGAYKYGLRAGLLIAVTSPLANHLLFGMPPAPMLPVLLFKGTALAVVAALVARRAGRVTLPLLMVVVAGYQLLGGIGEAIITGSLSAPLQDIRLGWPGLLLQVVLGYVVISHMPSPRTAE